MDPTKPILGKLSHYPTDLYSINDSYAKDRERPQKQSNSYYPNTHNRTSHVTNTAYNNNKNTKSNYRAEPSYQ